MKTIIITWEQYQDQEVIYPFFRAKEEGEVALFANKKGRVHGILGAFVTATHEIALLQDTEIAKKYLEDFDLLILPGGVKAMEKLRQEKCVTQFVASWDSMGKTIASTCSGAQLLISAEILKGRKVSAYYGMEIDIKNAGAVYVNEACVIDKNLISSPHYDDMSIWLSTAIRQVKDKA
ncbi:ThiJ Putative intracellular protease/amidase [Oxalobacteraceae bacterium]|jgi:protease I